MRWRYTLIDRFDTRTRIDQPVGWDSLSFKLKRHPERHGTFRELQTNQFRFYNKAGELLRAEYEQWGIRGRYDLLIEGMCSFGWDELYRGRLSFGNYDFVCGTECYAVADLDQVGPLVDFINRFDQKVEIGSLVAFDKTTVLTDYASLKKNIVLPSKAILLRVSATNSEAQEYKISDDSGWFPVAPTGYLNGGVTIPFTNVEVNNLSGFKSTPTVDYLNYANSRELVPPFIENLKAEQLNCLGTLFTVEFRVKGRFKNLLAGSGDHSFALTLKTGLDTFNNPDTQPGFWLIHAGSNTAGTWEFDISYTGDIELPENGKLWLAHWLIYEKFTNYTTDVRVEFDPETFFKASVVSKCDPTKANVYMIHETASRVVESITNNALKLSSSYYGRTDSQPFAFPDNGCGALRAVTPGLEIRRAKLSDGSNPQLFLSMKDIFESLTAIDNIGIGEEEGGKIVMESWRHFYQDEVAYTCKNLETVEKQSVESEHYSVFKAGYDKWETEDYDGLDEILTKREFRTELSEVQNPFEQVCKFIASGYAWETTRRKGPDSKDWRYDNDTFLACLDRKFTTQVSFANATNWIAVPITDYFAIGDQIRISGTEHNNGLFTVTGLQNFLFFLAVGVAEPVTEEPNVRATFDNLTNPKYRIETGNILNPQNLLDPPTVYNFRITPLRNALRWFNRVAACYRHITNGDSLVFTAGDGNYLASGLLADNVCRLEGMALAENAEINLSVFGDPLDGTPFARPERIKFTCPLSFTDYKLIAANAYKLIQWQSSCETGQGWIDELEYLPEEGQAKFTLITKAT